MCIRDRSKTIEYAIEVEADSVTEAKELIEEEIQENDGIYNYEIEASVEEYNVHMQNYMMDTM